MKAVLRAIRILVVILFIETAYCQDGYSEQDILRLQHLAANEGQIETITSYSTNIIQRDPNSQSISTVSVQYHMADDPDKTEDNNRSDRSRIKKVYHIKNPFQRHTDEDNRSQESKASHLDNGTGASNQYAAMQYSLPPEEFLQQMRADNQYHQQQQQQLQSHQQQQQSTQTSALSYTATPQPQYQFSTISTSNYDIGNQQSNQISQLEPKSLSQVYHTASNNFQYSGPNSFGLDIVQSTPSPIQQFLSTPLPNNQYLATPSNTYVSSSSPMYLSSPPSLQQYVSSPLSTIQTGSPDYSSSRVTTTIGSNSLNYDSNDLQKRMQIDHYDNSANGVRYPTHQQYQNEYPSSTLTPTSQFPEHNRVFWQNTLSSGVDSKLPQDLSRTQFQNSRYNNNNNIHQDSRQEIAYDSSNSETHRIGSAPAANNVYLNFVQPDYQLLNNLKSRARDYEQETSQPEYYSHGDYGWKLSGKKTFSTQEGPTQSNYPRYQTQQADSNALSQINFNLDTSKSYNYDQISKSSTEKLDAQEFAKAAARAHEHYKQQQLDSNNYPTNTQYNHNHNLGSSNSLYVSNNDKQKNKLYAEAFGQSSYTQNNQQNELITLSPYFYSNVRENSYDTKVKHPFDHDKALKNIVPIDVSNVVSNSENQVRQSSSLDSNNRYSLSNYAKEQSEQNIKQYYKPITDSYYKDKNAIYGFNIKTKSEETVIPDRLKQIEGSIQLQGKPQPSETYHNQGIYNDNKRFNEDTSQTHYLSQLNNYQDSLQSSANIQQQGVSRPLNQMNSDLSSILKLNDIPLRLTQGLSADSLRLHNNNFDQSGIPTPLPVRLNQNVDNHQIDVAASILNKLISNKPTTLSINRPEVEPQNGNFLSTINGFKVANPYNMDLKLVADMLKGKPTIDESNISPIREQFNKPVPLKLDISQLQQLLLKNENSNLGLINTGLSSLSNPYFEIYNPNGYYQGVKYSRSQEEEENIPIAAGSSNHPIGAVMEEADPINEQEVSTDSDTTAVGDDDVTISLTEDRPKNSYSSNLRAFVERHRHPNSLIPGRNSMQRKYPKSDVSEPYPLLKPPPRTSRNRAFHNSDKHNRRRRVNKPKILRIFKTEPLFEADSTIESDDKPTVTTLLKPPPVAQDKSDKTEVIEGA